MRTIWIVACKFQRTKDAKVEEGLAFGHEPGLSDIDQILDTRLEPVATPVWSYHLQAYKLSVSYLMGG